MESAKVRPPIVNGRRKDVEQAARRSLGSDGGYAAARQAESEARTERIRQIMAKEAGELVERVEAERILLAAVTGARGRFHGEPRRLQALYPEAPGALWEEMARGIALILEDLARTPWTIEEEADAGSGPSEDGL